MMEWGTEGDTSKETVSKSAMHLVNNRYAV